MPSELLTAPPFAMMSVPVPPALPTERLPEPSSQLEPGAGHRHRALPRALRPGGADGAAGTGHQSAVGDGQHADAELTDNEAADGVPAGAGAGHRHRALRPAETADSAEPAGAHMAAIFDGERAAAAAERADDDDGVGPGGANAGHGVNAGHRHRAL